MRKLVPAVLMACAGVAATAFAIPARAGAYIGLSVGGVPAVAVAPGAVVVAPALVHPGPYLAGPRYFYPGLVRYGYGYPGYRLRYGYGYGYHHVHGWGRPWR